MKLDQLRQIIGEEVRSAIKSELQDILTDAVKIASAPSNVSETAAAPSVPAKDVKKQWQPKVKSGNTTLDEMLNMTANSMSPEDAANVMGSGGVNKPNFASQQAAQMSNPTGGTAGLDLNSIPGFDLAKSKAILEAANKKDKTRHGK